MPRLVLTFRYPCSVDHLSDQIFGLHSVLIRRVTWICFPLAQIDFRIAQIV